MLRNSVDFLARKFFTFTFPASTGLVCSPGFFPQQSSKIGFSCLSMLSSNYRSVFGYFFARLSLDVHFHNCSSGTNTCMRNQHVVENFQQYTLEVFLITMRCSLTIWCQIPGIPPLVWEKKYFAYEFLVFSSF